MPVARSLFQLEQQSEDLSKRLNETSWIVEGVKMDMVSINLEENAVELVIDPGLAGLASKVLASPEVPPNVLIRIKETPQFASIGNTDAAASGGQRVATWIQGWQYAGDGIRCSDAFPVVWNGSEGILTACHC
ncbi:MAG: hypothetical protein N2037_06430 [Acidimicrobiales bacterium]|nr:hypothetical protein [Acidimicrobiales bacterium]